MELSKLPAEQGFRHRGEQVTRLETFVDAAFAFSLTLLVIFFNDLPDTVAELRDALRRVPTFAACFVLLTLFWMAHNRWSRRFGLDDGRSTVLSLALVLVVLVFVYPLRMVASSGLHMLSGGWVPSELGGLGADWLLDLQTVFMVYAVGFGLLAWLVWRSMRTRCDVPMRWRWMRTNATRRRPRSTCTGSWPRPRRPACCSACRCWLFRRRAACNGWWARRCGRMR